MRTPDSRAPFALRLAVRLLPKEVREEVLGDLIEHWNLHVRNQRWLAKVVWAWRQPLSSLVARLRFSRKSDEQGRIAGGRNMGVGVSWLDFKLGFRMLVKYPGLTVVAGLAIAFAVTLGAGSHELVRDLAYPDLPLDEGDRIVEIRNQDVSKRLTDPRALHDFVVWRDELRSVQEIGAYQTFRRNLITERGPASPLLGADMTAAAFGIARVPPLLGRALGEADEVFGAPDVLVIGFDVWRSLFGSDPDVVGRTVRLGSETTTIIGVMPAGFGWPWSHDLSAPLRLDVLDFERGESPRIRVVARLAPGLTLEEAQTELTAVGLRMSADPSGDA